MNQTNIDNELRRRAAHYLAQTHLHVDYYRIRRSLAYPLPVTSFHCAEMPLRGMRSRDYPWSIWLAWALEERITALGHAATFCGMAGAQDAARRDIEALAAWPTFRQLAKPDLSLGHCRLGVLRSDALAAMRGAMRGAMRSVPATSGSERVPSPGAHDVHYAAVLRSGYAKDDLAVVMAASSSSMGHIHHDNGSVVIGTHGRWMICDPGYQQYLDTSERVYTVGPQAHNAPVINGAVQTCKQVQRPQLDDLGGGVLRMRLELQACYPITAGVRTLMRNVWLVGKSMVAICDRIELTRWESLSYHWHGHPSAAWWMANGEAQLHWEDSPGLPLHLRSPQVQLTEPMLDRLPGSRGQLTLTVPISPAAFPTSGPAHIWWFFMIGAPVPTYVDGASARVGRLLLMP